MFRSVPSLLAPLLAPLFASLAFARAAEAQAYLPGSVLKLGQPSWPTNGAVEELHALRFSWEKELDAVARIGDQAVLVHHPGRFRAFFPLGAGFEALAVLRLPGSGPDVLLGVDATGLTVTTYSASAPYYTRTTVLGEDWKCVEKLVVSEEGGLHRVFGLDPQNNVIRHATWISPSSPAQSSSWQDLGVWGSGGGGDARALVRLEYSTAHAGLETAILWSNQVAVLTSDGSGILFVGPAAPGDLLGELRYASADLLLDLSSSGSSVLFAGNAAAAMSPHSLNNRTFVQVLAGYAPEAADAVVLPEASAGRATVLGVSGTAFQPWADGKDRIDAFEPNPPPRTAIRCAATGDFDRDRDWDILATFEDTSVQRLWLNHEVNADFERVDCTDENVGTDIHPDGQVTLTFPLRKNSGISSVSQFHVQAWLDPDPLDPGLQILLDEGSRTWTAPSFDYSVTYDPGQHDARPEHVVYVSITADAGAFGPTRTVAYSFDGPTRTAVLAEYPQLQNAGDHGNPSGYLRSPPPSGGGPTNP
jgi:hypothetical protein